MFSQFSWSNDNPTISQRRKYAESLKGRPAGAGFANLCVKAIDAGRGHVLLPVARIWGFLKMTFLTKIHQDPI
jgi:hypothetical protein